VLAALRAHHYLVAMRTLRRSSARAAAVRALALPASAALLAACASTLTPAARVVPPAPGGLPPVPSVSGPLDLRVVYPGADQLVTARDSTFVFGSVGSGDARLTIDGQPVRVAPNGAFLAFVALPGGRPARWELVAVRGADTARRSLPIRLARRAPPGDAGALVVDSASVSPRGAMLLRADERVRVSVRAPAAATAWVQLEGGVRHALVRAPEGLPDDADGWSTELPAALLAGRPMLHVARGGDTVRLALATVTVPARVGAVAARSYGVLGGTASAAAAPDSDRVVVGRPFPDGTYKWFFLPGTVVEVTGRQGASTRVRLDEALEVWVATTDVAPLPEGYAPPRRTVGHARVLPSAEWVDVVLPVGRRPAHQLLQQGTDVELTLYDTQLSPDIMQLVGNDTLVRQVVWEQVATDRARLTLRLSQAPFGYLVLWDAARSAFVLRLRRAPAVDARRPLHGITIAVDAGHPPGGATGGTGLTEAVAVLPVAERVRALLAARGATVLMTRTTAEPLGLAERGVMARRANAHALVSIHLNAFPDGVNPFTNNGTSTLFFHQQSEPLARLVQREMVARMGLRDLGVHYQNLAVARPTWFPAVLTEGLFLMVPEQEAAMRSEAGRELYARAVADGVEAYFASLATGGAR
jgi:N-acetylmuramoyl-L-alanine amidase